MRTHQYEQYASADNFIVWHDEPGAQVIAGRSTVFMVHSVRRTSPGRGQESASFVRSLFLNLVRATARVRP